MRVMYTPFIEKLVVIDFRIQINQSIAYLPLVVFSLIEQIPDMTYSWYNKGQEQ